MKPELPDLSALNKATYDLQLRAARGECAWVCPSCSCGDHRGMPDECMHGNAHCTELIKRDKAEAKGKSL